MGRHHLIESLVSVAGEGASSGSHPRAVPALLPAGMGDGDGRRHQSKTRVRHNLLLENVSQGVGVGHHAKKCNVFVPRG